MTKTITLRLSDEAYNAVKRYADVDGQSMNGWVEGVLDAEDMRRRCAAHGAWMEANPQVASAALAFNQVNQQTLAAGRLPNLASGSE